VCVERAGREFVDHVNALEPHGDEGIRFEPLIPDILGRARPA
jgi:hypothetical protein